MRNSVTKPVDNKKFNKLSAKAKRCAIVADAIAQIVANRYEPAQGTWCRPNDFLYGIVASNVNPEDQLQPIINNSNCRVCGLGSLFASAVGMLNDCPVGDWLEDGVDSYTVLKKLQPYFSHVQLAAIEIAFETGQGSYPWMLPDNHHASDLLDSYYLVMYDPSTRRDTLEKCGAAGSDRSKAQASLLFDRSICYGVGDVGDKELLLKILRNIIRNKGTFVPPAVSTEPGYKKSKAKKK